jgi:hypothetical protein
MGQVSNDKDGLTMLQRAFVEAITGPAKGNAAESARLAGYDTDGSGFSTIGCRNLNVPAIQRAIAVKILEGKDTPEWARASLMEIAATSMTNFLSVDERGNEHWDWKKAHAAGAIGQIRKYKKTVWRNKKTGIEEKSQSEVELYDRAAAVDTLMKLLGMVDASNMPREINITIRTPGQIADRLQATEN